MATSYDHSNPFAKNEMYGMGSAIGEPNRTGDELMFPPIMSQMILATFWEKSFVPDITNTNLFNGMVPQFGRKVRFMREPEIIVNWRKRNAAIKHNTLKLSDFEVEVGREGDWSYKINEYDWDRLWSQSEYQTMIVEGARKAQQAEIQKRIVRYMLARVACENWGNGGGVFGEYCMGDYDAPLELTTDNVLQPFQIATTILAEHNLSTENLTSQMGSSDLFALVPPIFAGMMPETKHVDRLLAGNCAGGCEMIMRDGMLRSHMGFDIYSTNCLPRIQFADQTWGYPLLMGAKSTTGFAGINRQIRIIREDKDDWGVYIQGRFVTGWEVFWPEALVLFIVKFKWDAATCGAMETAEAP